MSAPTRRWPRWILLLALACVTLWALLTGRPEVDATPSPAMGAPSTEGAASSSTSREAPLAASAPPDASQRANEPALVQVRVLRPDQSVVPGARVRLTSVVLPEAYQHAGGWYGGLCFPAGVPAVVAALRSGVSPMPLGEAVTDAQGVAEFRLSGLPSAVSVLAEDPGSGERGVVVERLGAHAEPSLRVILSQDTAPRRSIVSPGGATATAFDEERLAVVDLPVAASGAVNFGEVRFGVLFLEKPGHGARAYPFGPGSEGSLELPLLGGRVRVELPSRLATARVELSTGCLRWQQEAIGGLVIANDLPAEGYVLARLVDRGTAMDDAATGGLVRGETTQLRLGFEPAAIVRVTVVDEQGASMPAIASVTMEASPKWAKSDLEFRPSPLEVGPLPLGKATLEVTTQAYSEHQQALELIEGVNAVTVHLAPEVKRVRVTGRLRHHAGREVAPRDANSRVTCFGDGTCERQPTEGYVEVELAADPLDGPASRLGGLEVVTKGPVGQLEGSFGRGRWRLRGWGSDGSVLRETEISVPGPPVELVLMPAPAKE